MNPLAQPHPDQENELAYLSATLQLLQDNLDKELVSLDQSKRDLIEAQEQLQENPAYAGDTDQQADTSQYLDIWRAQASNYQIRIQQIKHFQRMLPSPYFGRIDFIESGYPKESIYIGRGTLMDPATYKISVYDWRAPISSIFYRNGLGPVAYQAPKTEISGEVTLKRQYSIQEGRMEFFFDTALNITDQSLVQALSHNASAKMKDIVETIQKEQDIIIRDLDSDLLMVQGTAGSGKTSVALHRVAFLMYQALANPLVAHNIVLITPNLLFNQYISQVLPDLGEENITSLTFNTVFAANLEENQRMQSKYQQSERLLSNPDSTAADLERATWAFQTSSVFCTILDRLAKYYEHKVYRFPDFYYNGVYLAQGHELKEELLRDRGKMPFMKRLEQIKVRLFEKIQAAKKARIPSLEEFVADYPDHQLEIRSFARLLSMKRSAYLLAGVKQLDQISFTEIYRLLFQDEAFFYRLAKGLELPDNIALILEHCTKSFNSEVLNYGDAAALTYLRIKLSGTITYPEIKQVVVDEVQDYGPLHFLLLKRWFPKARYTVLGDVNQSVDYAVSLSLFEEIKNTLSIPKATLAVLQQSFRSSYEISEFSRRFIDTPQNILPFKRHEAKPTIKGLSNQSELDQAFITEIQRLRRAGYTSIALLCKTMNQAQQLYDRLGGQLAIRLINETSYNLSTGASIMPIYLAKGMEFDAVLIYDASAENYHTVDERRLLYIASTRALHHLTLYYTGQASPFIVN